MGGGVTNGDIIVVGNKILISASSISISPEGKIFLPQSAIYYQNLALSKDLLIFYHVSPELGIQEDEEDNIDESPEIATEYETESPNASTSYNQKHGSQLRGLHFLGKLKRGPVKGLHHLQNNIHKPGIYRPNIHKPHIHRPNIPKPSIPSIKKLSKKKSRHLRKSVPELPSTSDSEFYCFESSWLNFSLSDIKKATNDFNRG